MRSTSTLTPREFAAILLAQSFVMIVDRECEHKLKWDGSENLIAQLAVRYCDAPLAELQRSPARRQPA